MLATASANPGMLVPPAFQPLASWKPKAHFASITAELDRTQISFCSAMRGTSAPGQPEAIEWRSGMKGILYSTAASPNYRYFIEKGTFHTFLGSDMRAYGAGANGTSVAAWMRNMIKPGDRTWDSLEAPQPF